MSRAPQSAAYDAFAFAGWHKFVSHAAEEGDDTPSHYGSFEVFYQSAASCPTPVEMGDEGPCVDFVEEGWYWWPCFPGCLPDGDPSGPFPTAEGAYLDAIGE